MKVTKVVVFSLPPPQKSTPAPAPPPDPTPYPDQIQPFNLILFLPENEMLQ